MADNNTAFGLELNDGPPEGSVPTEAVVIYQYLDPDGNAEVGWTSTGVPNWQVLGMAETLSAWVRSVVAVADEDDE